MSLDWRINIDFAALEARLDAATPEALGAGMEHIRGVSAEEVPVETGRLVGSADVQVDGDEATITYAGPYARYQHERLDLRHEHGKAKYLEDPVRTETQTTIDIVARRIEQAL